ncbi:MAG: tetratricopeptide repeat protein [candidate division Zixibacteria bacterium]|nr:tetratricopeptide repeat protein [candidate division Zixibacteria bacterium]
MTKRKHKTSTVSRLNAPLFETDDAASRYRELAQGTMEKHVDWIESAAEGGTDIPAGDLRLLSLAVYSRSRQHRKAIISGQRYCEEMSQAASKGKSEKDIARTKANLAFSLNLIGHAHRETADIDSARACFESAVEYAPTYEPAYLSWAALENTLGNRSMAKKIVESGLKRIRGSAELRMLRTELERPTVSVCMIVKDEEACLGRCLESVRDVADEIILVDTGSSDNTVKIAESYGCKVFHQAWEGDFSKHRNYSIEQAACDWIFIIDADEQLIAEHVLDLKRCLNQDAHPMLSLTVYNLGERSGKAMTFLPSVRIFRRGLGLRYEGIVHNRLNYATDTPELRCPVGINHYGYDLGPEAMRRKHERSRELLLKQLDENPDFAFAHFNLAQLIRAETHFNSQNSAREVLNHAKRVIALTDPKSLEYGSIHLMAHHQAATACYALGEFETAACYCSQALGLDAHYLDASLTLAHTMISQGRLPKAAAQLKEYLRVQESYSEHTETNTIIMIHLNSRDNAFYHLGKISESGANWIEALEYYNQSLGQTDPYMDCYNRLGWCAYRLGRYEDAEKYFTRQIENEPAADDSYLGMAAIAIDRDQSERAERILRSGMKQAEDNKRLSGRLGQLLISAGRSQEALELMEQALVKYPNFGPLHSVTGDALNGLGRFVEAISAFEQAEKFEPGLTMTAIGLANALLSLERNEESIKWFKTALSLDPHSALGRRNLALALMRTGKNIEAEEYLRSYIEVAPDDRQARTIFGALMLELGKNSEALGVFESLLRDSPADADALLALSDCYLKLGGVDSAIAGYRRLLQNEPGHTIAAERLAALQIELTA